MLKEDVNLFSQLFISCQIKECDLEEFFQHENQAFPASLSDKGGLLSGQKSQLVNILENKGVSVDSKPECDNYY